MVGTAHRRLHRLHACRCRTPRLWSPDDPFLYDLRVTLRNARRHDGRPVGSYFGMREIGTGQDVNGKLRPRSTASSCSSSARSTRASGPTACYTAPTDAALKFDLQKNKDLGFNMVRKHIKVEPQRWYYWADRLGLLVWQDMPPCRRGADGTADGARPVRDRAARDRRRAPSSTRRSSAGCLQRGLGRVEPRDTGRIADNVKAQDPTRLVNAHSGVNCCNSKGDSGAGDIIDWHEYLGPASPAPTRTRVAVLGEHGGIGLRDAGHKCGPTAVRLRDCSPTRRR